MRVGGGSHQSMSITLWNTRTLIGNVPYLDGSPVHSSSRKMFPMPSVIFEWLQNSSVKKPIAALSPHVTEGE